MASYRLDAGTADVAVLRRKSVTEMLEYERWGFKQSVELKVWMAGYIDPRMKHPSLWFDLQHVIVDEASKGPFF